MGQGRAGFRRGVKASLETNQESEEDAASQEEFDPAPEEEPASDTYGSA